MFTQMTKRTNDSVDPAAARRLAEACGLSQAVAEVLLSRGCGTEESAARFLRPGRADLHDPFLLAGMRETVDRLRAAVEGGETVVVYGDYDADGICATAILTRFLVSKGVTVCPYIPSRKHDGYGITLAALERLIEEALPDLILTCDCGISAQDEIEAIADSGVDVIVTDHHEVPRNLPDCVVVNPKLAGQDYPFDGLCGAGVAWKVVQAYDGIEAATEYLDLAALATIADLVPLTDENRAILTMGLAKINARRDVNPGILALLDETGAVTATDLAYRVAPRINAAGRMGDATRAFRLLTSENQFEIAAIAAEIDADNTRRKELCARVYDEAKALIRESDLADAYCIVLAHPDWEKGLTSIVAAQIAGEYKRPTFLVVRNGSQLKGTARSVEGVNIYEVLRSCEDLLIEYGGHAQAAGFSVVPENLDAFRLRVDEYLHAHFDATYFLPKSSYDAELPIEGMRFELARELTRLEPFGNGNPRPVFKITVRDPMADTMRQKPNHLVVKTKNGNINAFGYGKCYPVLHARGAYALNVELSVNRFNGRDYLSSVLRDFDFAALELAPETEALTRGSELFALARADRRYDVSSIDAEGIRALLNRSRLGTLLVAYSYETYRRACADFALDTVWHSLFTRESESNFNRIVLSPTPDFDAFGYAEVVLLDGGVDERILPFDAGKARVRYAAGGSRAPLDKIDASRAAFVREFSAFRRCTAGSALPEALAACTDANYAQAVACWSVFFSLGFVRWDNGIVVDGGCRRDLAESAGYRMITEGV